MIVSDRPLDAARWMQARLGIEFRPPFTVLASMNAQGEFESALLFQCWTANDIEISVVADRLPRSLLRASSRYAVQQLGCRRATFRTRSDNVAAIDAMARLGAMLEGRLRKFYPDDVDALIFGILKEDYPHGVRT